ncbi:MAG TPA: NlpC/P60 family protein [Vicinamibacterales bacterium]|nr:NlpC/P60 family protein [Vicinamibacterales bacterium]
MTTATRPWTDAYVGLSWRERGRDRDGVDCWGLVRLALLEQRGIELPMYVEGYAVGGREKFVAAELHDWVEVAAPDVRAFDLVELRGNPRHVGLCDGRGRFLQVLPYRNAVLTRLDSVDWAPRIIAFRRRRETA